MSKLTYEEKVFNFIESYMLKNHFPPTHQEILDGVRSSSKSMLQRALVSLEGKRMLTVKKGVSRGIVPVNIRCIRC